MIRFAFYTNSCCWVEENVLVSVEERLLKHQESWDSWVSQLVKGLSSPQVMILGLSPVWCSSLLCLRSLSHSCSLWQIKKSLEKQQQQQNISSPCESDGNCIIYLLWWSIAGKGAYNEIDFFLKISVSWKLNWGLCICISHMQGIKHGWSLIWNFKWGRIHL